MRGALGCGCCFSFFVSYIAIMIHLGLLLPHASTVDMWQCVCGLAVGRFVSVVCLFGGGGFVSIVCLVGGS